MRIFYTVITFFLLLGGVGHATEARSLWDEVQQMRQNAGELLTPEGQKVLGDAMDMLKDAGADNAPILAYCGIKPYKSDWLCALVVPRPYKVSLTDLPLRAPISVLGERLAQAADQGQPAQKEAAKALIERWYKQMDILLVRTTPDIGSVLAGDAKFGLSNLSGLLRTAFVVRLRECASDAAMCKQDDDINRLIVDTLDLLRQTHKDDRSMWQWFADSGWRRA